MPVISRFLGVDITLLYNDHAPPHFHAKYGDYEMSVNIHDLVVEGRFPPRALKAVLEWAELHRAELLHDWELARQHQPLVSIAPLE